MEALASTHGKTFETLTFPLRHSAVLSHINERKKKSEFSVKSPQNSLVSAHEIIWRINEQIGGTESITVYLKNQYLREPENESLFRQLNRLRGVSKSLSTELCCSTLKSIKASQVHQRIWDHTTKSCVTECYEKTTWSDISSPQPSHLDSRCHFLIFSGIVASKNEHAAIIFWSSYHSKPYDFLFFCEIQKKIFGRMPELLFSISIVIN